MVDAALERHRRKPDQVRCLWERSATGVHRAILHLQLGVGKHVGQRVADYVERCASYFAIEIRAVRDNLGQHAEFRRSVLAQQSATWYYDNINQILYVYSSGGDPVTAYGSVTPIILSGQSLVNINAVSYIEVQHIKLDWYDGYGLQVQGASDHIWLANMIADSQVPNATVPIGFYVHPSGTPGDIHIYNTDAHRNYVGYRFDNTPTAIELENCRAYAKLDLWPDGRQ